MRKRYDDRPRRRHPSTSAAVMLLTAASSIVAQPIVAQPADAPRDECPTPEEMEQRRSDTESLWRGEPPPGYHGISYRFQVSASPGQVPKLDAPPVVDGIPCDSPAHRADLREGDVLLSVNSTDLSAGAPLRRLGVLRAEEIDARYDVCVRRDRDTLLFYAGDRPPTDASLTIAGAAKPGRSSTRRGRLRSLRRFHETIQLDMLDTERIASNPENIIVSDLEGQESRRHANRAQPPSRLVEDVPRRRRNAGREKLADPEPPLGIDPQRSELRQAVRKRKFS